MNLLPYHISYIKWIVAWVAIVVYLLQLFLMKLFTCINFWFFDFPKVLFTSRMYTCVLKHRIRIYEMIMQLLLTKLFTCFNFWFFNLVKLGEKTYTNSLQLLYLVYFVEVALNCSQLLFCTPFTKKTWHCYMMYKMINNALQFKNNTFQMSKKYTKKDIMKGWKKRDSKLFTSTCHQIYQNWMTSGPAQT